MNTLFSIFPYKYRGFWVFDDEKVGLFREPILSGTDVIVDRMTEHIQNAAEGFRLLMSASPFPGATTELEWRREECGGDWYHCPAFNLDGWLCSALFKYVETAPPKLYAKAEPKAA